MIDFTIIDSQIHGQIGDYKFGFNQVIFSKSSKSHVLTSFTFALEVVKDKIFLISPQEKILVNGKYSGELYNLKKDDILSFNDFSLQVLDFKFTEYLSVRNTLNKNTDDIIKNHPSIHKVLTKIRQEIKSV